MWNQGRQPVQEDWQGDFSQNLKLERKEPAQYLGKSVVLDTERFNRRMQTRAWMDRWTDRRGFSERAGPGGGSDLEGAGLGWREGLPTI